MARRQTSDVGCDGSQLTRSYSPRPTLPAALLKPLQSGRSLSTHPFLLNICFNRSQLRPLAPSMHRL